MNKKEQKIQKEVEKYTKLFSPLKFELVKFNGSRSLRAIRASYGYFRTEVFFDNPKYAGTLQSMIKMFGMYKFDQGKLAGHEAGRSSLASELREILGIHEHIDNESK